MLSILVIQNGASSSALTRSIEAARSTGLSEIIVITEPDALNGADSGMMSGVQMITTSSTSSLGTLLSSTISRSRAQRMVLLDARLAPSNAEFQRAVGAMSKEKDSDIVISPLIESAGANPIELNLTADRMIPMLSNNNPMPLAVMTIEKESLTEHLPLRGETVAEMLSGLILRALVHSQIIDMSAVAISMVGSELTMDGLTLSPMARSRCIQLLIDGCNIEELFPKFDWRNSEQESAAAAYQSLAGSFMKLGDTTSALECVRISESFEDSPRSLALKGMIAQMRGETLGAVANMVASLQQYELKKRESKKAGNSTGSSLNVERITDNLQAGLAALNRADNSSALQHFSQAVLTVDPFFSELGLTGSSENNRSGE